MIADFWVDENLIPHMTITDFGSGYSAGEEVWFELDTTVARYMRVTVLNPGAVSTEISTRKLDANEESTGDSGNITFKGESIVIGEGASLLADAPGSGGHAAGDITLEGNKIAGTDPLDIFITNLDKSIVGVIVDGEIKGGDVKIISTADHRQIVAPETVEGLNNITVDLSPVAKSLENLSIIGGVAVSTTEATVNVGKNAVITADTLDIESQGYTVALGSPISIGLAAAVAVADTTSNVFIEGDITTTGSTTIRSQSTHTCALRVICFFLPAP